MNHLHTYDEKEPRSAALTGWEIEALTKWFLYRMDMDTRRRLMRELPCIYNKLTGVTLALYIDDTNEAK